MLVLDLDVNEFVAFLDCTFELCIDAFANQDNLNQC